MKRESPYFFRVPDADDSGGGVKKGEPTGNGKVPVKDGRRELFRYAALSSEVLGAVLISVFAGIKADKWLRVSFPLVTWLLPLLVIVFLTVKLVKESSRKK